jgi:ClpP class serine protease
MTAFVRRFLLRWKIPTFRAFAWISTHPAARSLDASIWLMSFTAPGKKPIHAILTESAYSAAYAIASAADRISVPRTGGVGSVGVITMHLDWTQRIKDDGLKVTIITYGSRKAEGSPLRELSDEALAAIQQDINTMGELFVNTVARNRGLAQRL